MAIKEVKTAPYLRKSFMAVFRSEPSPSSQRAFQRISPGNSSRWPTRKEWPL